MSFSLHTDGGPSRTDVTESQSINKRFASVHHLSVVFLSTSRPALRTFVNNETTFDRIQEEMHRDTSEQWILLQAHYGPKPYWTPLEPANQDPIGAICQTLYAFNRNIGSEYVLAVVRRPDSDCPLVLHAGTTVREAAESADPHLKTLITSITWGESQDNIGDSPFSSILAKRKSHPNGLIINAGEGMSLTPKKLRLDANIDSMQGFLQGLFLDCKDLIRRAFDLDLFSLQLIHVSYALFHVIVSLSSSLDASELSKSGDADQELAAQGALRIAIWLAEVLQKTLDDTNKIMERIDNKDLRFIRRDAREVYWKLCGEYPGAVTIRHEYGHFEKLRAMDLVSDVSSAFGKSAKHLELRDFFRDSVSPLIKLLENRDSDVRLSAVVAIGSLVENPGLHDAIRDASPLLVKLREDENPKVRSAVAVAISNLDKHREFQQILANSAA